MPKLIKPNERLSTAKLVYKEIKKTLDFIEKKFPGRIYTNWDAWLEVDGELFDKLELEE